jgi:hypothetical protein
MTLLAEIAIIVIAAVAVAVSVALLPSKSSARRHRPANPEPARPSQLVALERLLVMARVSALQVHAYLRPILVEIASQRLAARGQTLERMPEATGRRILGDDLWEIVRPGRPFPENRHGPGVAAPELEAMLEVLERL